MSALDKYAVEDIDSLRSYILTKCETRYWFGGYPTIAELLENLEVSELELRQVLSSDRFKNALEARGLPPYSFNNQPIKLVKHSDDDFDPAFVAVCNVILDPGDSRSFAAKMKTFKPLGITSQTWEGWMKIPKYEHYVTKLLNDRFDKSGEQHAKLGLLRNIQAGDLQSIKYYFEITNKYRPIDQNTQTLAMMLTLVMEILGRHVPPHVIDTVAEELEQTGLEQLILNQTNNDVIELEAG